MVAVRVAVVVAVMVGMVGGDGGCGGSSESVLFRACVCGGG